MDRLWAPWRIEYIRSIKEDGCIFCDKPENTDDREMLYFASWEKRICYDEFISL